LILNLDRQTALELLEVVNTAADQLLELAKNKRHPKHADIVLTLHALGTVKHRIEFCLGFPNPFRGSRQWGYPRPIDKRLGLT
jgi:hypothetical protein